jgi:hypothetical protein
LNHRAGDPYNRAMKFKNILVRLLVWSLAILSLTSCVDIIR